jgi:hypothetical protein
VSRRIFGPAVVAAIATAAFLVPAGAGAEVTPLSIIGPGTSGGAAGQFKQPTGLAIDSSSGTIVVADKYNGRIAEYTPGGTFIRAFGEGVAGGAGLEVCTTTCVAGIYGGGAGELYAPTDVALDSSGLIYVSDTYNNRISVFTQAGTFVRAFGWDVIDGAAPNSGLQVCTSATGCQQGTNNETGAGAINKARGVDIGPDGNVWVADQNNHRIDVFTPAGGFVRTFGWGVQDGGLALQTCTSGCQAGIGGAKAGQLSAPRNVSLDADTVYVAEGQNNRISEFTPAGAFIRAFGWDVIDTTPPGTGPQVCTTITGCQVGASGAGAGQFNNAYAVLSNGAGLVYAADVSNNRINVFTKAGAFVKTFGWGVSDATPAFQICTAACQAGSPGLGAGQMKNPEGLAFDCRGGLWVGDQDNYRLQRFGEPGTPLAPCPPAAAPAGPTGKRAAALKKCKKKHSKKKRKKCRKRAKKLPV